MLTARKSDKALGAYLYDTTLRDGHQTPGVDFSVDAKLRIVSILDQFGIPFIEAGWPGSNPIDTEVYARLKDIPLRQATITAFGSTRRKDIDPTDDLLLGKLASSGAKVITIFGKTDLLHVTDVLKTSPEENLRMIEDSVRWLSTQGASVVFDAEHFFDGWKRNREYALQTLIAAQKAGAECLVLCDTNGGCLPWEIEEITSDVLAHVHPKALGIHTHNDSGCAVSNALTALRVSKLQQPDLPFQLQGTINGLGERTGNADLSTLIPNIALKMNLDVLDGGLIENSTSVSQEIALLSGVEIPRGAPYVSEEAFAHKGGTHANGVEKNRVSFEHVPPESVGNSRSFPLSGLAGKATILALGQLFGLEVEDHVGAILDNIKTGGRDLSYLDGAEASKELFLRRLLPDYVTTGYQERIKTISNVSGTGLFGAACEAFLPELGSSPLHLRRVRSRMIQDLRSGKSKHHITLEVAGKTTSWRVSAVSENEQDAWIAAVSDAFEYALIKSL